MGKNARKTGPISFLPTQTRTSAFLLVADGNTWVAVALSGDGSITSAGALTVSRINGVTLGTVTATSGRILVADGTQWVSVAMSGDATITSAGALTIAAGALAASVAGRAKMADAFFNAATVDSKFDADSIGEDRLTANELTGRAVANVANANVIGGILVLHRINVPAAAGNTDVVLTHKTRVLEAWFVKDGAGVGGETVQLTNVTVGDLFTAALSINVADDAIARAASMVYPNATIAAGNTFRVTTAGGVGNTHAGDAYVLAVRSA